MTTAPLEPVADPAVTPSNPEEPDAPDPVAPGEPTGPDVEPQPA